MLVSKLISNMVFIEQTLSPFCGITKVVLEYFIPISDERFILDFLNDF